MFTELLPSVNLWTGLFLSLKTEITYSINVCCIKENTRKGGINVLHLVFANRCIKHIPAGVFLSDISVKLDGDVYFACTKCL